MCGANGENKPYKTQNIPILRVFSRFTNDYLRIKPKEAKFSMYKYETHLHTYPVSGCAKAGVRESLEFYKSLGYDGVFITNHFLDGNVNLDHSDRKSVV